MLSDKWELSTVLSIDSLASLRLSKLEQDRAVSKIWVCLVLNPHMVKTGTFTFLLLRGKLDRVVAFVQLDVVFAPSSMALSFAALWWELCDNICIQGKATTFFGPPPIPLRHKHFWNVARRIFVFILSHWKRFLQLAFFLKAFYPIKGDCHESGWKCTAHKRAGGKRQMGPESSWPVTDSHACISPQLFCLNWCLK